MEKLFANWAQKSRSKKWHFFIKMPCFHLKRPFLRRTCHYFTKHSYRSTLRWGGWRYRSNGGRRRGYERSPLRFSAPCFTNGGKGETPKKDLAKKSPHKCCFCTENAIFPPKSDLFVRSAQEHVKYVTTDAKTYNHLFSVYDGIAKTPLFFYTKSPVRVLLWWYKHRRGSILSPKKTIFALKMPLFHQT